MCRPQSTGGRRCPLHSSSGFVGTRLARRSSGLDSRQVNATFQVLRHEGARAQAPTVQQWAEYLQEKAQEIESSEYGSRTVRAMRKHIEEAADQIPDGPTYYALTNLDSRAKAQREALNEVVDGLSETLGISRTAARQRFAQLRSSVDMSRDAPLPSGYSSRVFRTARNLGMPLDTPSLHALGTMTSSPASEESQERRRVQLREVPESVAIHSIGYDNGRLEIRFRNDDDSPSEIYAYRNVPESVWQRFGTSSPGYVYNREIRNNDSYRYANQEEQEADAVVRRCAECGQFASSGHTCPSRQTPLPSDNVALDNWVETADWEDQGLANNLVAAEEESSQTDTPSSETSDQPEISEERIAAVRTALADLEQQRAQAPDVPDIDGASEYSIDEYVEDLKAFEERRDNGDSAVIPYMTENATNGLLTPENGMGFGVELEFVDDGDHSVRERIGQRLHEEGIISSPYQRSYHAGAGEGWTGWSYEADETVAGEIVSPVLYDRPEDWETLRKVCDIVREEGGHASFSTGGHVHVSSAALGNSIAQHAVLLNTIAENEDLIYRLGTNPEAARHRSVYWCAPNRNVDDSYEASHRVWRYDQDDNRSKFMHFRQTHGSHTVGLNMQASGEGNASHVEFRQFDGSLNPAVIQAQVKLSAALVAKAARTPVEEGVVPRTTERRGIGTNASALNRNFATEAERHAADSQDLRNLASQTFTRREDRAQLTALFASTKWQSNLPVWDEAEGDFASDGFYEDDYDYDDSDPF